MQTSILEPTPMAELEPSPMVEPEPTLMAEPELTAELKLTLLTPGPPYT